MGSARLSAGTEAFNASPVPAGRRWMGLGSQTRSFAFRGPLQPMRALLFVHRSDKCERSIVIPAQSLPPTWIGGRKRQSPDHVIASGTRQSADSQPTADHWPPATIFSLLGGYDRGCASRERAEDAPDTPALS
jgi:hypothetical protein